MANMTVPVSVIIPTHNSASTIERALNSVFVQTTTPMEIIVVDDASTDSTCEIVTQVSRSAGRSVVLHKLEVNLGPSYTRNTGWGLATADFVAFLDSDDSWHPKKLEIQSNVMLAHPTCEISGHLTGDPLDNQITAQPTTRSFGLTDFLWRNRVSTPTIMVKRTIPERFDIARWYAEDYDLWLRIISRTRTLSRIELPLTKLYKADYGDSGLSSHLVPMFLGEVSAVRRLKLQREISLVAMMVFTLWMTAKFVVRVAKTSARRMT
jgi:glycosyltransferase involved in cell wall biosynthesis